MTIQKIMVAVMALLVAVVFCGCQQGTAPVENEPEQDLPELVIGVDILKPFFYVDENGDYAGIDAEIATEACRRAGYKPVFTEISWDERDDWLQDGTVDCLWSAFIKDGREKNYLWTDTYLQSNLRAIVDDQSPDREIASVSAGHGGMAVRAGSKIEEYLLGSAGSHPRLQLYTCGTFAMAETAFVKGYAGALGGHEAVLAEVIKSYPGLYRFLDGSMMTANLGVAFAKNDTTGRCQAISDALDAMKEDGTIDLIAQKYYTATAVKEGGDS